MLSSTDSAYQIVIGFDFSDQSRLALDHALAMAPLFDTPVLHVLGVLDPSKGLDPYGAEGTVNFAAAEEAQKAIAAIVDEKVAALSQESIHHFVHTRIGDPAKELIGLADETNANLIIVGTHGRKGVTRLMMGSIAEKVVRHGTCPVLVARAMNHPTSEIDESLRPEPPCPQCVKQRLATKGKEWWCEEHSKDRDVPHPVSASRGRQPRVTQSWLTYNH